MSVVQKPKPLGIEPSFGFGDRLGLATPGHLDAILTEGSGISPIFAQQSIREMARTRRSPAEVMQAATQALASENFAGVWSADADHLKTAEDVERTAAAGFVFFTIDPSDYVDAAAAEDDEATLREKFARVRSFVPWFEAYRGKVVSISSQVKFEFDERTLLVASVKYGRAIVHAIELSAHIGRVMGERGEAYEIELSVDETPRPTTLAEHYLIADVCFAQGMKLVSLAPRFVGDFEKGIDFRGDLLQLQHSLEQHAQLARHLGDYKLSLHSGSDKLSTYPLLAKATKGRFHVKTAGTSYLEALRVAARHDTDLFRRIVSRSRANFATDRATYHISAELSHVPPPEEVREQKQLERYYLDQDSGRQILHVTFGSVLTDVRLAPELRSVLREHAPTHRELLATHFGKHLRALRQGM